MVTKDKAQSFLTCGTWIDWHHLGVDGVLIHVVHGRPGIFLLLDTAHSSPHTFLILLFQKIWKWYYQAWIYGLSLSRQNKPIVGVNPDKLKLGFTSKLWYPFSRAVVITNPFFYCYDEIYTRVEIVKKTWMFCI